MNIKYLFFTLLFLPLFVTTILKAQSSSIMYFCERYDPDSGEINISDRFTNGHITVMVKSDYKRDLKNVHIPFYKWDTNTNTFKFYKKFNFTINPE